MDRLEELYFLAFNCNCFKEAHKRGVYDLLRDLENHNIDSTLLALTVVRKLYQRLETVSCPYLKIITHGLIIKNLLVNSLVKYLDHRNQHVVFSTTKALVQVLQTIPNCKQMIKEEWFQALFAFGQETEQPWRKIYIMELLNMILTNTKEPLKNINENSWQQNGNKKCSCTHEADGVISTVISRTELAELFLGIFNFQHNLFYYLPFIVRPNGMYCFMRSCQHSGPAEDFVVLQACLKLADAIHNQENVKRNDIAKTDESNLVAFLHCIATVAKYLQVDSTFQNPSLVNVKSHCQNENYLFTFQESDSIDHNRENMAELCEGKTDSICAKKMAITHIKDSTANQLYTVMATLIQYLHYPRLPPQIFKKILAVVNQILVIPLLSQKSKGQKLEKIVISSSISFLSVVECCLFHKIPQCHSGFVGFSGTKIKGSLESPGNKKSSTDLATMRKASLLVFKSSFVVLKLAAKQEGSLLFQKLSLSCISLWCSGILSLVPNSLFDNKSTQECSSESEFHDCLVALFVDQDDDLVEVVMLLLLLYQEIDRTVYNCSEVSGAILLQLNPHLLFIAFVESIDFDHSLLLDLLISSETRFLEYLVQYLHFVVDGWDSFVQCLAECKGRNSCSDKQATSDELSTCSPRLSGFESDSNSVEKPTEFENRLSNEIHSRKNDLFFQEQENFIVGEEVCLETPKDVSRGTMFETRPEVCQSDFHLQGNLSDELNGLTSIVLAYCSSDGSDIEFEAENESANDRETPAGTQSDCMSSGSICLKNNLDSWPLDKAQTPAKFHSSFTTKSYSACATDVSGMPREYTENLSNPLFEERYSFFSNQLTGTLCLNVDGYLENEQSSSSSTKVLLSSNKDTKARITKRNHIKESFGDKNVPQYEILDKTMTMMIRLRMSIVRLSSAGHFPYSAAPLITLMENVEKCYDGC